MAKTRKLWSNFSKGELSGLLEGRPDLAAYFEGGSVVENYIIRRQGGLARRVGLRFIAEGKISSKDTILWPFEFSVNDAFVIEVGDLYTRFYKNRAQLKTSAGGPAVEVVTPYTEAQLREIHFTQSADVLFLFHASQAQRRLNRVSDTNWTMTPIIYTPPPSFEADTDISGGSATLTPGATSGTGVTFTASSAVFLADGDQGRQIIFGASRAVITMVGPSAGSTGAQSVVTADILDAFPDTNPIPAGSWFLRLSPQTTLDPTIKAPVGAQVTLVAPTPTFRTADVGKFIVIYGGLVKLTILDSNVQVRGEILSEMGDTTDANPAAAPAGSWTLEEASWSASRGFPRTGEFFQGRLGQAASVAQPTTTWLSASDDFENYAVGVFADNALEYVLAARQVNRIEWLADNIALFLGTAGAEFRMIGSGNDNAPLGGNVIPLVEKLTTYGCAPIQPIVLGRQIIFLDRSRRKLFTLAFNLEQDGFDAKELTVGAEHITGTGIRVGHMAFQRRLDPRIYLIREDGTLVTMTYFQEERVIGFTRFITDGIFESVAVIPEVSGGPDQVWVIVKRTINGVTKRYVEMLEENHADLSARAWTSLQTDSAVVKTGLTGTVVTGLSHLEAKTVTMVKNGSVLVSKTVASGQITLDEALISTDVLEIGLPYTSTVTTMRPAIEGEMIEGLPRSWDQVFGRFKDTIGGKINGQQIQYVPSDLDTLGLFTGDRPITDQGWDTEGRITIEQPDPYPMNLLAVFGTLSVGDRH